MLITGFYAALLALLALILAGRVVRRRGQIRIGVGDGGDADLMLRQRVHGNLLEYVPLALLLLLLVELAQAPAWTVHLFGATLLLGRLLHAWGLAHSAGTSFGRFVGTALTWLVMLAMIGLLLGRQIAAWL